MTSTYQSHHISTNGSIKCDFGYLLADTEQGGADSAGSGRRMPAVPRLSPASGTPFPAPLLSGEVMLGCWHWQLWQEDRPQGCVGEPNSSGQVAKNTLFHACILAPQGSESDFFVTKLCGPIGQYHETGLVGFRLPPLG